VTEEAKTKFLRVLMKAYIDRLWFETDMLLKEHPEAALDLLDTAAKGTEYLKEFLSAMLQPAYIPQVAAIYEEVCTREVGS
jgi:hypothetical protein